MTHNQPLSIARDRWPDDYVPLEPDKLLVRSDYVERFRHRDWRTARAVLVDSSVAIFRRVAGRENAFVTWDDPAATPSYLKRHAITQTGENSVPGWHEATATGWCQAAGVATASIIAAGQDETLGSFFMSEELTGFLPIDQWAPAHLSANPQDQRRQAFLAELAKQARRFHDAGLSHRDFYWCHHFARATESGGFDLRLIDLQRLHRPTWRKWRWRLKDLAQLFASAPATFFARNEREQWFKVYTGVKRLGTRERAWLVAIETRAGIYKWREKSA